MRAHTLFFALGALAVNAEARLHPRHLNSHQGPAPEDSAAHALVKRAVAPATVGSYVLQGCWTDPDLGHRALAAKTYTDGTGMTNEACASFCAGYTYFGTEYGQECYCANTISNGAAAAIGDCSYTCKGNTGELCGAGNRLDLYKLGGTVVSSTTTTPAPTATAAPSQIGNFALQGCWTDPDVGNRALRAATTSGNTMTNEACASFCAGYTYFGTEYAGECYCGNTLQNGAAAALTDCNMACSGNKNEYCGGGNRLDLYKVGGATTPTTTTPAPSSTTSAAPTGAPTAIGSFVLQGCWTDPDTGNRALRDKTTTSNGMTNEVCASFCAGYAYFGTEYGAECYCGNSLLNGAAAAASDCNMACAGSASEKCGAGLRLDLYKSSTTPTSGVSSTTSAAPTSTPASSKMAFAHFLVGVVASYNLQNWVSDIQLAKAAHIDGFALNIASSDGNTANQVALAFQAANQVGGFKLFFSFDYVATGAWPASGVISYLQQYGSNAAYFKYKSVPFVSTFEGPGNSGDWNQIKASVPNFLVPDWASVGCGAIGNYPVIDGAFSWDSWPTGASNMNTGEDQCWINNLGAKPYMMGVSPMFYTDLKQYNKNWLWRGDTLWYDRWQEVFQINPQFVEIISWNDFGESSYIGPIYSPAIVSGSERYVNGSPHDGWRALLPYFIDQYKYGSVSYPTDQIVYWYRTTPATAGGTDGTLGNAPWQAQVDPTTVVQDLVFMAAVVKQAPVTVSIQIGNSAATTKTITTTGVSMFTAPFNGQTGAVTFKIIRGGTTVASATGPAISNTAPNGLVNFNAQVGTS